MKGYMIELEFNKEKSIVFKNIKTLLKCYKCLHCILEVEFNIFDHTDLYDVYYVYDAVLLNKFESVHLLNTINDSDIIYPYLDDDIQLLKSLKNKNVITGEHALKLAKKYHSYKNLLLDSMLDSWYIEDWIELFPEDKMYLLQNHKKPLFGFQYALKHSEYKDILIKSSYHNENILSSWLMQFPEYIDNLHHLIKNPNLAIKIARKHPHKKELFLPLIKNELHVKLWNKIFK